MATQAVGSFVMPMGMPMMEVRMMLHKSAPRTRKDMKAVTMKSPMTESSVPALCRSPKRMALSTTRIPALFSPSCAMKMPTAAPMASLMERGMSLTMTSRMPRTVSRTKTTPDRNTIPIPTCHVTMPSFTSVKAKKALPPMPVARAKGRLA